MAEDIISPEQAEQRLRTPGFNIIQEIQNLKQRKNAIILSHYYQDSEIQDIADFIGDSLELSRRAAESKANLIIFAGVKFMAETAKILNPGAKVCVPDLNAGCSLEESCPASEFAAFRDKNPDHIAITYINCSTEVKALSDIICTSSNAEALIRSIPPERKILFSPDRFLGGYLAKKTGREMTLWHGSCIVHERFSEERLVNLISQNPDAKVIAHPECPESVLSYAEFIGSTSFLLKTVQESKCTKFIVMTESGIIHQMKKLRPDAEFLTVPYLERDGVTCINCNNCPFMRLNSIEKTYIAIACEANEIKMDENLRLMAKKPLDKMLEFGKTGKVSI